MNKIIEPLKSEQIQQQKSNQTKKITEHKAKTNQNKTIPHNVTDTQEEQDLQEVKKTKKFLQRLYTIEVHHCFLLLMSKGI